mgnify:CR=1 FL=1
MKRHLQILAAILFALFFHSNFLLASNSDNASELPDLYESVSDTSILSSSSDFDTETDEDEDTNIQEEKES